MADENHPSCSECHHMYDAETGLPVKGWERVYIVSPGPGLCLRCKDSIIDGLVKGALA